MNTRFYVMAVQHNKEANAENRTVPSAYDDEKKAKQKFHEILSNDMKNTTLDWSIAYILTNEGLMIACEKWSDVEEPEPEPAEEPTVSE